MKKYEFVAHEAKYESIILRRYQEGFTILNYLGKCYACRRCKITGYNWVEIPKEQYKKILKKGVFPLFINRNILYQKKFINSLEKIKQLRTT